MKYLEYLAYFLLIFLARGIDLPRYSAHKSDILKSILLQKQSRILHYEYKEKEIELKQELNSGKINQKQYMHEQKQLKQDLQAKLLKLPKASARPHVP